MSNDNLSHSSAKMTASRGAMGTCTAEQTLMRTTTLELGTAATARLNTLVSRLVYVMDMIKTWSRWFFYFLTNLEKALFAFSNAMSV